MHTWFGALPTFLSQLLPDLFELREGFVRGCLEGARTGVAAADRVLELEFGAQLLRLQIVECVGLRLDLHEQRLHQLDRGGG